MEQGMDFGIKIVTWYDRSLKLWTAVFHDSDSYQIGVAGYGTTKSEAIKDLNYQNLIF
jgi:hypothetical protein